MENETKNTPIRDFVRRNKGTITVAVTIVATTAACIIVNRVANNQMVDFIKDKGLWDEYLTPEN